MLMLRLLAAEVTFGRFVVLQKIRHLRCGNPPGQTVHTLSLDIRPVPAKFTSVYSLPVPLSLHTSLECNLQSHTVAGTRFYCGLSDSNVRKRVDEITDLFFEARELLDDAKSSADTIYFNEDMQDARGAVENALSHYEDMLSMLSAEQRRTVVAAIGLRMEELKAHLLAITEDVDNS